jgi:hypothetical protein
MGINELKVTLTLKKFIKLTVIVFCFQSINLVTCGLFFPLRTTIIDLTIAVYPIDKNIFKKLNVSLDVTIIKLSFRSTSN